MKITFYDTASRAYICLNSADFRDASLNVYICGPTVYNLIHIGNVRTLVFFDAFLRFLKHIGFNVNYIRNITDVDDKIIDKAAQSSTSPEELAQKFTAEFHKDMSDLGAIAPNHEPKATGHIPDIVRAVSQLIDSGHAYVLPDGVYFDVASFADYGKLSRKKQSDLLAGARIDVDDRKKNPSDFAVWKFVDSDHGLRWPAPFGDGRPGWHIECSVMSSNYAPGGLHIHGGGVDLIHPHHENEIAQSEALRPGQPFSRYWIHVAFLNMGKEKMSKSLGNFVVVRELLKWFHPEVIRFFVLSGHYRSPLEFTVNAILEKHHALWRFYTQKAAWPKARGDIDVNADDNPVMKAMADDANTPKALGIVFELGKKIQRDVVANKVDEKTLERVGYIRQAGDVLGLFNSVPEAFFADTQKKILHHVKISKDEIESQLARRQAARAGKNFEEADKIRGALLSHGIIIQDLEDEKVSWCVFPRFD